MQPAPRMLAEPYVTATECAAAGLAPAAFSLVGSGFSVAARLKHGCYLALTGPDGARVEVTPCGARTVDDFLRSVRSRLPPASPVAVGAVGEAFVADAPRTVAAAVSGEGDGRTDHVGVLIVDPLHAPQGLLALFSVPSAEGAPFDAPRAGEVLSLPVFDPVHQALRLGAPSSLMRASSVRLTAPRPAEIEYTDGAERVRRKLGPHETLGRARDNTILLTDTMASKHHAVIEWSGDRYVLHDRGSINGTRVDGLPVRAPVPLSHNARIELGRVSMRFRELANVNAQHLHELVAAFEREGLALPHVPPSLGPRLQTLGPWFFATESIPARPLHGDLGVSMGARDYLVVCHGPTTGGVTTIQYCLGRGPLRLALECPWSGPRDADADAMRQRIAASLLGVRALVGSVQQCVRHKHWPDGVVLEVRALHGQRSWWTPVGGGVARKPTATMGMSPPDVLADALAWVHGL